MQHFLPVVLLQLLVLFQLFVLLQALLGCALVCLSQWQHAA